MPFEPVDRILWWRMKYSNLALVLTCLVASFLAEVFFGMFSFYMWIPFPKHSHPQLVRFWRCKASWWPWFFGSIFRTEIRCAEDMPCFLEVVSRPWFTEGNPWYQKHIIRWHVKHVYCRMATHLMDRSRYASQRLPILWYIQCLFGRVSAVQDNCDESKCEHLKNARWNIMLVWTWWHQWDYCFCSSRLACAYHSHLFLWCWHLLEARRLRPNGVCWIAIPCSSWIFMSLAWFDGMFVEATTCSLPW